MGDHICTELHRAAPQWDGLYVPSVALPLLTSVFSLWWQLLQDWDDMTPYQTKHTNREGLELTGLIWEERHQACECQHQLWAVICEVFCGSLIALIKEIILVDLCTICSRSSRSCCCRMLCLANLGSHQHTSLFSFSFPTTTTTNTKAIFLKNPSQNNILKNVILFLDGFFPPQYSKPKKHLKWLFLHHSMNTEWHLCNC